MGILDGIVEWIAEQVMAGLDLITTSLTGCGSCSRTLAWEPVLKRKTRSN